MNHKYFQLHKIIVVVLIVVAIAACTASPGAPDEPTATEAVQVLPTASPEVSPTDVEQPTASPLPESAAGEVIIDASDPCSLLTKENVEAAFGKTVQEVKPAKAASTLVASNIGTDCTFEFSAPSSENYLLGVTFYEGKNAVNYFAYLITALKQSCDEYLQALLVFPIPPLTEKYPSADSALLELPLSDLYRQYLDTLGECIYIHTEDRTDVGKNVLASEVIMLGLLQNSSSGVTVFGKDRVIFLTYYEPIARDAAAEFDTTIPDKEKEKFLALADKEKFYPLAESYRDQVLSGYTKTLIGLLQQAVSPSFVEVPTAAYPTKSANTTPPGLDVSLPAPRGETIASTGFEYTVLDVLRGEEALAKLKDASLFNHAPKDESMEYILVYMRVGYTGSSTKALHVDPACIDSTWSDGTKYDKPGYADVSNPQPYLQAELLPGEQVEGWVTMLARKDDPAPILIIQPRINGFSTGSEDLRYLSLGQ